MYIYVKYTYMAAIWLDLVAGLVPGGPDEVIN